MNFCDENYTIRKMAEKKITTQGISPKVSDILKLIAGGALLSALFLFPGAGLGFKAILDSYEKVKKEREFKKWEQFNLPRLRYILKRLQNQQLVEISKEGDFEVVKLTRKGQMRLLKYRLSDMRIQKTPKWDRKWRLVIYDITKFKRRQQDAFRRMLKKLEMLPLQKSVYMSPYPCEDEMEFLREYFDVSEGVLYITAEHIEKEEYFKRYFGL